MSASHAQLAHTWAAQTKLEGRSSSMYFEGPTIYSYGPHYPIARFVNSRIVFFNANGSTMTTESKHKPPVRQALHGLNVQTFYVPNPVALDHAGNLAHFESNYRTALLLASRARSNARWRIDDATTQQAQAREYCEAFDLDLPAWVNDEINPELLARARDADKENAKRRAAENAEIVRFRAEREAAEAAELARKVEEWKRGKGGPLPWGYRGSTMFRMSRDGASVETSRGATVPLQAARLLWRTVADVVKNKKGEDFSNTAVFVGDFQLREIMADGTCIVGCHTLEYSETRAFAVAQGWAE